MALIEFRILGPVEAVKSGRAVALSGNKQRGLLALLLIAANDRVASERLIEELWHGRPPASAAKSLQMHVARLRRAFGEVDGPRHGTVQTVEGGYRIRVEPGALDRERFETGVSEGRQLLAHGAHEQAAHHLRQALAEWRGPALADLRDEPFVRLEATRLDDLRAAALEDRIEADLATGKHRELVGELEALVEVDVFRERLWGQLLRALYRSGRQADALAAYRRVRRQLVEELGIEPGRELAHLHDAILAQDPRLDWQPAAHGSPSPHHLVSPGLSGRRHNLPATRTSFVGRGQDLAEIESGLRENRVLTLTGLGGVGKTRLALEVAERSLDDWPDGVWLVELASIRDPSSVAEAVASTLGLVGRDDAPLADSIAERLEERHMLLILDNCEHLLDACAAVAERIARGRSASRLLVTSRAPLGVAGERVRPVSPLPTPAAGQDSDAVAAADAVKLFLERAREARPEFTPYPRELAAVGELCRAVDGVPLSIELAASRVRGVRPAELVSRLGSRLSFGGRQREARHRNLEATIMWSYDLLDDRGKEAFQRLAVFPAPFTLAAAEHVLGGGDVLDTILVLVDQSILTLVDEADSTRYRMFETLREFGLLRLAESGAQIDAHAAYLDWALRFAEAAATEAETRARCAVLPRVEAEHRNLVGAIATDGPVDTRLRLAAALAMLLTAGTNLREVRRLLEDALLAAGERNTVEVRGARLLLGRAMCKMGELEAARQHLAVTAQYAAAADDRVVSAAIAADQALVEIKASRQTDAQAFLAQADALGARLDRSVWSYRLLVEAQMRYDLLGRLEEARELYERCIALVRRDGPPAHLVTALACLAELAVDLGDLDTASRCAQEVLAITHPVADAYPRGGAILALGRAALRAGQIGEATCWLAQCAQLDIDRGSMETAETLESLAHAVALTGRATDSATLLGAAAGLRERLKLTPLEREEAYVQAALSANRRYLAEEQLQRCLSNGGRLTERDLLDLIGGLPDMFR